MSIYSKIPIHKPARNAFNLSHSFKGSLNIGELVPISRPLECVPGDTFITGNITEIELNPIVTNFKGELYFESWQFFVSNDQLYEPNDSGKFTEILESIQNPRSILPLPYTTITNSSSRSICSYMIGVPSGKSLVGLNVVGYIPRSYRKIVNEWFRDENLEPEYTSLTLQANSGFYHINYKKDRFTSAFLSPQKGNPITLPLGNSAPIKLDPGVLGSFDAIGYGAISPNMYANNVNPSSGDLYSPMVANFPDGAGGAGQAAANQRFYNLITNGFVADLSNATAATIEDLRLSNKLQRWLEKLQLCGSRTKEFLLANYGIAPNDETLQRPVLIGHTKVPVIVNEVVANIKATNQSGQALQNSQGSRGGVASSISSFKYGKWLCKEFGWIITLGALRPKAVYTGGIHKSLTKDSVIDYWNPIFEHLGQQPIKNKELFISGTNSIDNAIYGYQDIFNEMRHLEDFIAEDLTSAGFQSKNIFRLFGSTPTLSRSFIEVKPTDYDYLFSVPSSTAPHAFFNSTNIIKAVRPISKRSTPSL